ncbi:MAG: expansin EXLX1 family cellulose-binding protein, partial [Anaerolineae bacterium]|nr:expansin EXLX1 family cellulose-binding protein [Anaerolineae bacterium]
SDGTDLVLSWLDSDANWYYHIYHGTEPDFVPADSNKLDTVHAVTTTGTVSWRNTWALLVNGDLYFRIKPQGCGGDAAGSNLITVTKTPPVLPGTLFGDPHTGEATYYWEADGGGNCMFPPAPDDVMVAAVADFDYGDDARLCGAYARVYGPYGNIQVRIVDRCPDAGCNPGHLDLHPKAFEQIAPMEYGRVSITWELVSPPLDGDISYHFKDESNEWWMAVQVRNHRNPLARFEVLQDGSWVSLPRQEWNHFLGLNLGRGPFTFRVTDIFGNQIVTEGVPLLDDQTYPGGRQFPQLAEPAPPAPPPPPPDFTPTDFVFIPSVMR